MWIEEIEWDKKDLTIYRKFLRDCTQLLVGTFDRKDIWFISWGQLPDQKMTRRLLLKGKEDFYYPWSYVFENGKASYTVLGGFDLEDEDNKEAWPEEKYKYIPISMKNHFTELGKQVPSLKESLEQCVSQMPFIEDQDSDQRIIEVGRKYQGITSDGRR